MCLCQNMRGICMMSKKRAKRRRQNQVKLFMMKEMQFFVFFIFEATCYAHSRTIYDFTKNVREKFQQHPVIAVSCS
jgi:hypothetical protein